MERIGTLNDCYIPDLKNSNNIILDSCVYDKRLLNNNNDINKLKKATNNGYAFYITEIQNRELCGVPDRTYKYNDWEPNPNIEKLKSIIDELCVKRVSCYGNVGYQYMVLLDGTYRVIEDESSNDERVKMFYDIFNHNNHHLRDAIIAEAAIYNNCVLVSIDGRLIRKVNSHFENKAMNYDEFIKLL